MSKEVKGGKDNNVYETLKTLYYSGKVKPTLNKILVELESDSTNIDLTLLACQCLIRTKKFKELSTYADKAIKLSPKIADGYYFKGIALNSIKGKEQDALKNFSEALALSPDNIPYLKSKGSAHFMLYTDYNLPIKFADKHRAKAEACFLRIVELIEQSDSPNYNDLLTAAEVRILLSQTIDAKKYFIKALNAYENTDKTEQDVNVYKDIIKAQKACIKLMEKVPEL